MPVSQKKLLFALRYAMRKPSRRQKTLVRLVEESIQGKDTSTEMFEYLHRMMKTDAFKLAWKKHE